MSPFAPGGLSPTNAVRSGAPTFGPPAIPLSGPLVEGQCVALGWPEPDEYDRITALRNRPTVRACFLDPRPLEPIANREWIARGMPRPREALISLRIGVARVFCGTIGWTGYDAAAATFEIGRLVVDTDVVRAYRTSLPADYRGVGLDASTALLRFAFETMKLAYVTSVFIAERTLARRINLLAGGRYSGEELRERPDGSRVRVVRMRMTRDDWRASRAELAVRAA